MKTLIQSVMVLSFSASLAAGAWAATPGINPLVNEYGEPAGQGNLPEAVLPVSPIPSAAGESSAYMNNSRPGMGGLYLIPGEVDPRAFESMGARQARLAATAPGTVTIGALEVLDSGPTGPMTPEAIAAANDEVTAQVLERIKVTDHEMRTLKHESKALPEDSQARFKAAANDVEQHRQELRESLKVVRASDSDQWTNARSAVAVNFNAYVASLHRAESIASGTASTE